MLYDGAHRFLVQTAVAMREGRPGVAGERLRRAEAIIDELMVTLNMEAGGEVAVRLQALYVFFHEHLERGPSRAGRRQGRARRPA